MAEVLNNTSQCKEKYKSQHNKLTIKDTNKINNILLSNKIKITIINNNNNKGSLKNPKHNLQLKKNKTF
jgi:hypothetical protein